MAKTKIRCNTCSKWFQSANAKELTCPDCVQKARREKMAAKNAPPSSQSTGQKIAVSPRTNVPPPPKPKPTQSGTSQWLDTVSDVKVSQPEQPAPPKPSPALRDQRSGREHGTFRSPTETGSHHDERGPTSYRDGGRGPGGYDYRGPGAHRTGGPGAPGTIGLRPRQPVEGGPGRGPRPGTPADYRQDKARSRDDKPSGPRPKAKAAPKPPGPPKPKREKIPPPQPFTATLEQIKQVEERYLELANPSEFDGIRTQVAKELSIPKIAVKKIIKELRDRQGIPSWWELQTYKGTPEELEKIKQLYVPLLPVPPVGVHKKLAEQLELKAGTVYQAIKLIRSEMDLPQYNDPTLHDLPSSTNATNGQHEQEVEVQQPSEEAQAAQGAPPTEQTTEEGVTSTAVSDGKET